MLQSRQQTILLTCIEQMSHSNPFHHCSQQVVNCRNSPVKYNSFISSAADERRIETQVVMHIRSLLVPVRQLNWLYKFLLINVGLNKLKKILNAFLIIRGCEKLFFSVKAIYCAPLNYSCQFFLITIFQLSWHLE